MDEGFLWFPGQQFTVIPFSQLSKAAYISALYEQNADVITISAMANM